MHSLVFCLRLNGSLALLFIGVAKFYENDILCVVTSNASSSSETDGDCVGQFCIHLIIYVDYFKYQL